MRVAKQDRIEIRKDFKMTPVKLDYLSEHIGKLSDSDLQVVYNRISGYNHRYFRVGNYYYKGYMIRNVIEKQWEKRNVK